MAGPRAIFLALDLARMPALAKSAGPPAVPHDVLELMRIAAACPRTCRAAEEATGVSACELTEAARFYLQQSLFRPDADCYRVLGLQPGAPRALARRHMRWLLQWLHPDRNPGWDGIYAERVVRAWREVSASGRPSAAQPSGERGGAASSAPARGPAPAIHPVRLPWISFPARRSSGRRRGLSSGSVLRMLGVLTGLAVILLLMAEPAGGGRPLEAPSASPPAAAAAALLPQGRAAR